MIKVNTDILRDRIEKLSKVKYVNKYEIKYGVLQIQSSVLTIYNSDTNRYCAKASIDVINDNISSPIIAAKVDLNKLFKILKNFDKETTIKANYSNLIITDGKKTYKQTYSFVKTYPFENFQFKYETDKIELEKSFTKELVRHIKFASNNDKTKVLKGVYFYGNYHKAYITTTDGRRAIKTNMESFLVGLDRCVSDYPFNMNFIIDVNVVKFIKTIKENVKSLLFNEMEQYVRISLTNDIDILVEKIDGNYPNIERLFLIDIDNEVTIKTKELLKTHIELLPLVKEDENKNITLDLTQNKIGYSYFKKDESYWIDIKDIIKENALKDIINYNCKFIIDILENIQGDTKMFFPYNLLKPFIIKDMENIDTQYLLAPLRTYRGIENE